MGDKTTGDRVFRLSLTMLKARCPKIPSNPFQSAKAQITFSVNVVLYDVVWRGLLCARDLASLGTSTWWLPHECASAQNLVVTKGNSSIMLTCTGRWSASDISGQDFPFLHLVSGDVHHQPMLPLPQLWIFAAHGVRIYDGKGLGQDVLCAGTLLRYYAI